VDAAAAFVQGPDRRGDGLGLGLAIVAEIVERWGGRLVFSARDGGGAVVVSSLPVAIAEAPASVPAPSAVEGGRLLVVEDDPTLALVLRSLLEHLGFEVSVVGDGESARGDTRPLVALTARGGAEDVAYCLASGFDRHLVKPVDTSILREVVSELLS
jgi:CheY-like chemotaxis protein